MDDNTTPPTTSSDAEIEAGLFAQAKAHDAGITVETPPAADAPATPGSEQTQGSNAPAATTQTTPTAPKPESPKAPAPEQKTETPFQQKRTDQQRLSDSWKKLNDDKAAFAAEREKFYREQAERTRGGQTPPAQPPAGADPLADYTPEQLESAADRFDKAGKFDLAEAAREAAKAKRATPPPAQAAQPPPDAAFKAAEAEWNANMAALEKTEPEFADPKGALRQETAQVLQAYPVLRSYPTGIKDAVELVKLRRTALEAEGLRKDRDEWKKRAEQAEGKLVPTIGAPESAGRAPSITEMGDAEAEAALLRMAQQQDAAA